MIGGCGLAGMIWRLAQERTQPSLKKWPHRVAAAQQWNGPDAEFYRLTDRTWSWWTGNRHHHKAGFNVSVKL